MRVSYRGNHRVIRGGGGVQAVRRGCETSVRVLRTGYFRVVTRYVNRNETFTHCRVILSPANWLSYDATTTKRARACSLRGLRVQSAITTTESWLARWVSLDGIRSIGW